MKTSKISQFKEHGLNVTYLTLEGYVELDRYRYLYFVVMLTIYIFVFCSDIVVVYLICSQRSLQEPMYVFIAALLVNSLVASTTIYPKLLTDFLSVEQSISYSACLCQGFFVYFLGSSGFTLLSAMAYDRYVSICKPLQYPTLITTATVRRILVLAWLLPACLLGGAALLASRAQLCEFRMNRLYCNIYSIVKLSCGNTIVNDMLSDDNSYFLFIVTW
ncbi:olfactory receptor 6N2-like [Polymixia lowei]